MIPNLQQVYTVKLHTKSCITVKKTTDTGKHGSMFSAERGVARSVNQCCQPATGSERCSREEIFFKKKKKKHRKTFSEERPSQELSKLREKFRACFPDGWTKAGDRVNQCLSQGHSSAKAHSRSRVPGLATLPGGTARTRMRPGARKQEAFQALPAQLRGDRVPAARPPPRRQPPPPSFGRGPPRTREATRSRGGAGVPPRGAPLTVALGPDKQGHALQPLHVAGRHMPGAPVVPLPVLVERVDLHPPPGVGHRAARGRGAGPAESPAKGVRGERAAERRDGRTPASGEPPASLPPLPAGPRRRPHGPLRARALGRRLAAPPLLGAIVRARRARPPTGPHSASRPPAPPREEVGAPVTAPLPPPPWPPRSRFPRRRRLLRPPPPCFPPFYLALPPQPAAPLRSPASNGRGRRAPAPAAAATTARETPRAPGARALRAPGRAFPFGAAAASSVFLTEPKPPPSWLALNSGARGHPGSSCRGGPLAPPFKETGTRPGASLRRRPRTEAGGGRRAAEVAGTQGAEEAERWSRRWRPGAPSRSLHAPSCERGAACASVAPCVRHHPRSGIRKGRGARFRGRPAGCLAAGPWRVGLGVRPPLPLPCRRRAASAWAPPPPGGSSPGRLWGWTGLRSLADFRRFSFGWNCKAYGKGHRFGPRGQPQVLGGAMGHGCGESRNLGQFSFSGPGTKPRKWQVWNLTVQSSCYLHSFIRTIIFLALNVPERTWGAYKNRSDTV